MAKQIDTRAKIEQAKELERQKRVEAERQLNRKINFFVMREVWNITRGRATKEMEVNRTIYETLGIRRERYSRAIDSGVIRLTKDELKQLVKQTGVESAIFEGQKCFQIEKVTRKDWEELFDIRVENIEEFNRAKANIIKKITVNDLKQGTNLYKLSVYFKSGISTTLFSLDAIVNRLEEVTFSQLDNCTMDELERYLKVLSEQTSMVAAIVHYKKLKSPK